MRYDKLINFLHDFFYINNVSCAEKGQKIYSGIFYRAQDRL